MNTLYSLKTERLYTVCMVTFQETSQMEAEKTVQLKSKEDTEKKLDLLQEQYKKVCSAMEEVRTYCNRFYVAFCLKRPVEFAVLRL